MKHIKLFENNTLSSVRKLIIDYSNLLTEIKPLVIEKYKQLASDPEYQPSYGDQPDITDIKDLVLIRIGYWDKGVQFVLNTYDNDGIVVKYYYIDVENNDLDDMLSQLNSNKYNL